jgi:hypothetical protein
MTEDSSSCSTILNKRAHLYKLDTRRQHPISFDRRMRRTKSNTNAKDPRILFYRENGMNSPNIHLFVQSRTLNVNYLPHLKHHDLFNPRPPKNIHPRSPKNYRPTIPNKSTYYNSDDSILGRTSSPNRVYDKVFLLIFPYIEKLYRTVFNLDSWCPIKIVFLPSDLF